jgi:hypothetical protein
MVSRKLSASISAGLLFFVISSPYTYTFVDSIVGGILRAISPQFAYWFRIAESGCPTTSGLILHSVVFALVAYLMMHAN